MKYSIVHIADIHYRKDEPEGALAILNLFIEDLKIQHEMMPEHQFYLVISGDIVFKGDDCESYKDFHDNIDAKLDSIGITKDHRILVPGNHDLDRDCVERELVIIKDKISKSIINETEFNNFIDSNDLKDYKFDNYQLFETEFCEYGISYNIKGSGWSINDDIGVYCLNSALCSFGGVDGINDSGNLAVYTRGVIDWCNKTNSKCNILWLIRRICG